MSTTALSLAAVIPPADILATSSSAPSLGPDYRPISEATLRNIAALVPNAVARDVLADVERIRESGGVPICLKGPEEYVVIDAALAAPPSAPASSFSL